MLNLFYLTLLLGAMVNVSSAVAQTYPAKSVRVIVPFPPGGGTDLMARIVAQKLSTAWGQQFIADNRSGAGGMIGVGLMVNVAPDGYTLLGTSSSPLVIGPNLTRNPSYNTLRDLTPVTLIGGAPNALLVHPFVTGEIGTAS